MPWAQGAIMVYKIKSYNIRCEYYTIIFCLLKAKNKYYTLYYGRVRYKSVIIIEINKLGKER